MDLLTDADVVVAGAARATVTGCAIPALLYSELTLRSSAHLISSPTCTNMNSNAIKRLIEMQV
jgi:hypothetical protein